jgi:hypothetical protein
VLENRHNADLAEEGAAAWRLFYEKFTDSELRRLCEIAERSEAGISPTVDEQRFLDDLEANYGPT